MKNNGFFDKETIYYFFLIWFTIACVAFIVYTIFLINSIINYNQAIKDKATNGCETFKLCEQCNFNKQPEWGIKGLSYGNKDYFCVWDKGRTFEEKNSTITHEMCHRLIKYDFNHFCEKDINKTIEKN